MALGKKAGTYKIPPLKDHPSHQQSIYCKLSDNYDYFILYYINNNANILYVNSMMLITL